MVNEISGKYSNKLISLIISVLMLIICISVVNMNLNWLFLIIDIFIILCISLVIVDIIFFEKYVFDDYGFKKCWNFFGYKLIHKTPYDNLIFMGLNKISFFYTIVMFGNTKNKLSILFLTLNSIGNCNEDFKKIKQALSYKKIIKGDENVWNC